MIGAVEVVDSSTVHPRSGGVWEYISPSRLNLWLKCPLAFRLRYIDGVKTPPSESLFLGQRVHAGLEAYYRHRMLGIEAVPGDVVARMLSGWDAAAHETDMRFESTAAEEQLKQEAGRLVTAYVLKVPQDEPKPIGIEARLETPLVDPFNGEELGMPLLGIVDLILDDSGSGPVLVDFKTAARSAAPLEITHEIQLSCYSYLFRSVAGVQEGRLEIRSLVKTKTAKIDRHEFPSRLDTHLRRLFAVIREYLDCLDRGRFNYRPNWMCGMCEFHESHCSRWCGECAT